MPRLILTIEQQIERLINDKNIVFKNDSEKEKAKEFLTKYNYLNITSLKYLYATSKPADSHVYDITVKFSILKKKYMELLRFENKIRDGVLMYETEMKVHFTLFLLDYLTNKGIRFDNFLKNLYPQIILPPKDSLPLIQLERELYMEWERSVQRYSPTHISWQDDYHLLIKILTFGKIESIMDKCYGKHNQTKIYDLFKSYLISKNFSLMTNQKEFKTIGILRNALCHKESLVTFLEKGSRPGSTVKSFLPERIDVVNFIYKYYHKNFSTIGRNLKKVISKKARLGLDSNSWIMNFRNYKLQHTIQNPFSKMKIYF